MKKIIVTLCSLALSIAGTFGINQFTSNDEAVIESNKQQINIEQDAEAVEDREYTDEAKVDAKEKVEDKASEAEDATPKAKDNTKEEREVKEDKKDKKEEKTTVAKKDKKEEKTTVVKKDKKDNNQNIAANSSQKNTSDYNNDFKSIGNNVYVYKNVDLSNCDSTSDVVKELQENGFRNINMGNIQNIRSLEDILSLVGDKGTQGNDNRPIPTKAPTKPAPTTTPSKPAPTTTPSKPEPTTPPTNNSGSNQGYAEEVLRLVNIERSKAGLSSLTTNATLKAAADKRAQETKTSFSHTRPNGSKFSTVLQEYGISYRTAGENIAYGQRSPQEVVNGWMNSPGHRANILNSSFGKIGIGVYQSGGVIYWSQLFTN